MTEPDWDRVQRQAKARYEYFDLLPKPIRVALANADGSYSAKSVYDYWQACGRDILKTIKHIHKRDVDPDALLKDLGL